MQPCCFPAVARSGCENCKVKACSSHCEAFAVRAWTGGGALIPQNDGVVVVGRAVCLLTRSKLSRDDMNMVVKGEIRHISLLTTNTTYR